MAVEGQNCRLSDKRRVSTADEHELAPVRARKVGGNIGHLVTARAQLRAYYVGNGCYLPAHHVDLPLIGLVPNMRDSRFVLLSLDLFEQVDGDWRTALEEAQRTAGADCGAGRGATAPRRIAEAVSDGQTGGQATTKTVAGARYIHNAHV